MIRTVSWCMVMLFCIAGAFGAQVQAVAPERTVDESVANLGQNLAEQLNNVAPGGQVSPEVLNELARQSLPEANAPGSLTTKVEISSQTIPWTSEFTQRVTTVKLAHETHVIVQASGRGVVQPVMTMRIDHALLEQFRAGKAVDTDAMLEIASVDVVGLGLLTVGFDSGGEVIADDVELQEIVDEHLAELNGTAQEIDFSLGAIGPRHFDDSLGTFDGNDPVLLQASSGGNSCHATSASVSCLAVTDDRVVCAVVRVCNDGSVRVDYTSLCWSAQQSEWGTCGRIGPIVLV